MTVTQCIAMSKIFTLSAGRLQTNHIAVLQHIPGQKYFLIFSFS